MYIYVISCDLQGLLAQCRYGNCLPSCPALLQDSTLEYKYLPTIKTRGSETLSWCPGNSSPDVRKHTTHPYNHFPDWKCLVVAFTTLCLVPAEWVERHNISNRGKWPFIRCSSLVSLHWELFA